MESSGLGEEEEEWEEEEAQAVMKGIYCTCTCTHTHTHKHTTELIIPARVSTVEEDHIVPLSLTGYFSSGTNNRTLNK